MIATNDDQARWDTEQQAEEARRFRAKVQRLKGELALALGDLREAALKLEQLLESECRALPLFDRADDVSHTNSDGPQTVAELKQYADLAVEVTREAQAGAAEVPPTCPGAIAGAVADAERSAKDAGERPLVERLDELGTPLAELGLPANLLAPLELADFRTAEHVREHAAMEGVPLAEYLADCVQGLDVPKGRAVARAIAAALEKQGVRSSEVCGCTEHDCEACVERTGEPCHWAGPLLCSACAEHDRLAAAVAEPEARCAACRRAGAALDANGRCDRCAEATCHGEATVGASVRLAVWSLPGGTGWAWCPWGTLGNWHEDERDGIDYHPKIDDVEDAIAGQLGLRCVVRYEGPDAGDRAHLLRLTHVREVIRLDGTDDEVRERLGRLSSVELDRYFFNFRDSSMRREQQLCEEEYERRGLTVPGKKPSRKKKAAPASAPPPARREPAAHRPADPDPHEDWRAECGPSPADGAAWEREVAGPAENSEAGGWRYVVTGGQGAKDCRIEYRVSPCPAGVAIAWQFTRASAFSSAAWRAYRTRPGCLDRLATAAKAFFAGARTKFLAKIEDLAQGREPTPEKIARPAAFVTEEVEPTSEGSVTTTVEVEECPTPAASPPPPEPGGLFGPPPEEGPYAAGPTKKRKGMRGKI